MFAVVLHIYTLAMKIVSALIDTCFSQTLIPNIPKCSLYALQSLQP